MNRPAPTATIIRVAVASSPNNLDPRLATDDFSVKTSQLIFSTLMGLDDRLNVVPELAERLDQPTPLTYVATLRKGVRFHDGHELTSDDVVFTFRCLIDPGFVSPRKGGYRELQSIDALDRYTVVFTLKEPFPSFPVYLVLPIVPAAADSRFAEHPIGTGPYSFVRYLADDRIELRAFPDHYAGRPANDGIILRVVPDDVMRGLELRKGTVDIVVNDLAPDIVRQLRTEPRLQTVETPGVDYQYMGLNLSDPILASVRVRRALAHAIDRDGIVEHLRQGLAVPAAGMMPPLSWAIATDVPLFPTDPARARTLLDEAGYPDPDGNGPASRFHLTLKISNTEFNRLQSAVIQENLQRVGIALDVRTYDFATMYADVLSGNFQLFTMQWTGESLADPDILRRVFHSAQTPPVGFNRGRFVNARIDALLDGARAETDRERRRTLYGEAQRLIADEVPYVSLWHKTNVAIAQRSLSGVRLSALGDFTFLKHVSRVKVAHAN
jgi:peptide/nickel transport system substrate-binding protein